MVLSRSPIFAAVRDRRRAVRSVRRPRREILQLFEHGAEPSGGFRCERIAGFEVAAGRFAGLELYQHPDLFVVQGIAQRREGFADAVGVRKNLQLLFQFGLFSFLQVGRCEFFDLVAEPLFVLASGFGLFAQPCEFTAQVAERS